MIQTTKTISVVSTDANRSDPNTCRHNTLMFGSGGFYVMCKDCVGVWVAIKNGGIGDVDLDHRRGQTGLTLADERHG